MLLENITRFDSYARNEQDHKMGNYLPLLYNNHKTKCE